MSDIIYYLGLTIGWGMVIIFVSYALLCIADWIKRKLDGQ